MKISNETKVGVLTIISLTILILGFNFLKGKDVLKKRKKIYAVFKDLVDMLKMLLHLSYLTYITAP